MKKKPLVIIFLFIIFCSIIAFSACDSTKYTVTFICEDDVDGIAPNTMQVVGGKSFVIPKNELSKKNHVFVGWSDGTQTYAVGSRVTMPNADLNLNAVWQAENQVRLVYVYGEGATNTENGEKIISSSGKYEGDSLVLRKHDNVKLSTKTLKKWKYNDIIYNEGDKIILEGSEAKFYAIWEERKLISIQFGQISPVAIGDIRALDDISIQCNYDNGDTNDVSSGVEVDKSRVNFEKLGEYKYDIKYGGFELKDKIIKIVDRGEQSPNFVQFAGKGTNIEPYLVYTSYQFANLRNGTKSTLRYYELRADIDFSGQKYFSKDLTRVYFDGKNKTIKNINKVIKNELNTGGLFDTLTNCNILNLNVESLNIEINIEINEENKQVKPIFVGIIANTFINSKVKNIKATQCVVTNKSLEKTELQFGGIAHTIERNSGASDIDLTAIDVVDCYVEVDVINGDKNDNLAAFAYMLGENCKINSSTVKGTFDINGSLSKIESIMYGDGVVSVDCKNEVVIRTKN